MKYQTLRLTMAALAVLAISASVGCGGGSDFAMVPVSGTITMDGEPLAGVQVNYFPQANGDTHLVGPFSNAITDDQGKYTLINRYGEPGAVVGKHKVSVKLEGIDMEFLASAEQEYQELLEDARDGDEASKAELPEAKKMLAQVRKAASRGGKMIPTKYSLDSILIGTVPPEGTDQADFELSSK